MDDGWPNLVEILEGVNDLHDNRAALLLSHQLILLQVEVQIVAFTVLQHCAEPGRDNTDRYYFGRCHLPAYTHLKMLKSATCSI